MENGLPDVLSTGPEGGLTTLRDLAGPWTKGMGWMAKNLFGLSDRYGTPEDLDAPVGMIAGGTIEEDSGE